MSKGSAFRKWCRILHRDVSYLFAGMILIYALSGILMNHRNSLNPHYSVEVQEFKVSKDPHVTFQSERKFKMYSDEELKKKVKSIDISGESAEVHVVLEPEEKEDEE